MNTRICAFTMRLFFLLLTLTIAHAGVIKRETQCDGPLVNGVQHKKEVVGTNLDRPYLLTTDYKTNTLYFSLSTEQENAFKSAQINLNTTEFSDIEGIPNGFAQAVDEVNNVIYIGGSDGIYKFQANSNKSEFYGARGSDIFSLYYKDVLYFSTFPSQFLFTLVDGQITRFKDLEDIMIDMFAIDNDDYLYYTNSSGFYSQKKGTKNAVYYGPNFTRARGLTTNKTGDVFACYQDGIYLVNKKDHVLTKHVDIADAFGVAFDNNNNIVYADSNTIVRLTPCPAMSS